MRANTEQLVNKRSTIATCLGGEARVDSYHVMSSILSFGFKDSEECAPTGVQDGFRQVMVLHHRGDLKVFYHNALIAFSIGFGRLEMMIPSLALDLEVGLGHISGSQAPAFAALLPPAQLTLLAFQGVLRAAIEAWVLNRLPLAIRQEGRETNVNADVRMGACRWKVFPLGLGLTDKQGVPMSISTMHQMHRFGCPLRWAVHLDFEEFA